MLKGCDLIFEAPEVEYNYIFVHSNITKQSGLYKLRYHMAGITIDNEWTFCMRNLTVNMPNEFIANPRSVNGQN